MLPRLVPREACYAALMILTWRNTATERFAKAGKNRFSGMDEAKARRRLDQLNAAVTPQSLGTLKRVGLHRLSGDRAGQSVVTINGPWRLVVGFQAGNAYDVEIIDYYWDRSLMSFGSHHPGETLREELDARGMSAAALSHKLNVPSQRQQEIL